ncbi:hypothetical protein GCM10027090_23090 [Sinomonas soli]
MLRVRLVQIPLRAGLPPGSGEGEPGSVAGRLEISASQRDQTIPGMASSSVSEKADSFSDR